jgi:hypothetical protein
MMYVGVMLCALGVRYKLFFQTDNGSEFGGGGGSRKRAIMEENFMAPLGIKLLSILKGQKEAQSFVERSHRTDDEEFYIPTLPYITSRKTFMTSAKNWVKYYNQKRSHGEREMDGKTPKEKIYELSLASSKAAASVPPLLLDRVSPLFLNWREPIIRTGIPAIHFITL